MGKLVAGVWKDEWYDTRSTGGAFVRSQTSFRNRVTGDGSSGFKAETRRYHLYVSLACPWACRTLIIRMLNAEFDELGDAIVDLYPVALRAEIDRSNAFVYDNINNGVYKAGFATTQSAYEEAFRALFSALAEVEERVDRQRYLVDGT